MSGEGVGSGTLSHQWHSILVRIMLIPLPLPLPPPFPLSLVRRHCVLFVAHQRSSMHVHKDDGCAFCVTEWVLVHLAPCICVRVNVGEKDTLNGLLSVSLKPVQCFPPLFSSLPLYLSSSHLSLSLSGSSPLCPALHLASMSLTEDKPFLPGR